MGINTQVLKILLAENSYQPLHGKVLLIGRSTVNVRHEEITKLFENFGLIPPDQTLSSAITKHQTKEYMVDDKILFKSLSSEIDEVNVLDCSPYEGADLIADLNFPIAPELFGTYDFVYDSSVIDNLFNPGQAIINIHHLLKPGGRYLGINVASFFPGALVSCHPEWFHSFFAVNNYADVKVYVTEQTQDGHSRFEYPTRLFMYQPCFTKNPNYNYLEAVTKTNGVYHTIAVAEKGKNEAAIQFPMNLQYISSSSAMNWAERDYKKTGRPILSPLDEKIFNILESQFSPSPTPHLTDHYIFLGNGF